MWHPYFEESRQDTAGLFVHFRREFTLAEVPATLRIHITADMKYQLYVNGQFVAFGPVKGDRSLWFFDEIDIAPYLTIGKNVIAVRVLRFFYATSYAPSFPQLPSVGLRMVAPRDTDTRYKALIESSTNRQSAIDTFTVLRVDQPEDHFLHIYERISRPAAPLAWTPAKLLQYKSSTGNAPLWQLSPRLIPQPRRSKLSLAAVRNRCSTITTAFLRFRFQRPASSGSLLKVTYSEAYESEPESVPWVRRKGDRCDYSKDLFGPSDVYEFEDVETFAPFHYRTFRGIRLEFTIGSADLVFLDIDVQSVTHPLDVHATFSAAGDPLSSRLWNISIRTLQNCMHDCYEDCLFYEQLQYAMDTRSSALFTYCVSCDDRLARQAILQLHSSFNAHLDLTQSRAPTHKPQYIPHFSLYWCLMVCDHLEYFDDKRFVAWFVPVVDAVLGHFHARLDDRLGLVTSELRAGIWNFVDWAELWKPHGIPPSIERTGILTFANQLYAYPLDSIRTSLREHCFDGSFYTDTLVSASTRADYSQHCQTWAVLCGSVSGAHAQDLLARSIQATQFTPESIAMSFYRLRALSEAGGTLYEEQFSAFWTPWRRQLDSNMMTWVEDEVCQRSDCHAWGSVPLYEFVAEVAGVHAHSPRLELYKELEVRVPIGVGGGGLRGVVCVE
ncbi:hypothetical protein BJY01DRAFT_261838 [Aspergillus pseudoustus]|uniref:Alpha-L-rhamnosidase six-hairpin glycosidase domain-containing protein n=1 Tax=Aspergillus pseudoustus TaxID=1810923 RepID=A0ABR4KD15_9EURO